MRSVASFRLPFVLVALAVLVGCRDVREGTSTGLDVPTPGEAGLYPLLGVQATKGATLVELRLAQVPSAVDLASYQGELRYDAALLQLDEVTFPEGVTGAVFEASKGTLRFVGTAGGALRDAPLLRLRFRPGGEITRGAVSVTFEEVTAAADLADLTASVKNEVLLIRKQD